MAVSSEAHTDVPGLATSHALIMTSRYLLQRKTPHIDMSLVKGWPKGRQHTRLWPYPSHVPLFDPNPSRARCPNSRIKAGSPLNIASGTQVKYDHLFGYELAAFLVPTRGNAVSSPSSSRWCSVPIYSIRLPAPATTPELKLEQAPIEVNG